MNTHPVKRGHSENKCLITLSCAIPVSCLLHTFGGYLWRLSQLIGGQFLYTHKKLVSLMVTIDFLACAGTQNELFHNYKYEVL